MIVLDTNVVSELMKPRPDDPVRDWLTQLRDEQFGTTAVTIAEIEFGLRRLPPGRRGYDLQSRFETFAAALTVLPLDDLAARETGRFRAMRAAAGLSCPPSGMTIAVITAVAGATLATRNTRDFEGCRSSLLTRDWRVERTGAESGVCPHFLASGQQGRLKGLAQPGRTIIGPPAPWP